MNNDELEWHDGVLDEMHVKGNGEINVTCYLYPSSNAKTRERYFLNCIGVTAFTSSIDVHALLQNKRAGNVNNGRIESPKRGDSVLKLFLSDGYIELAAKKITIDQMPDSD